MEAFTSNGLYCKKHNSMFPITQVAFHSSQVGMGYGDIFRF